MYFHHIFICMKQSMRVIWNSSTWNSCNLHLINFTCVISMFFFISFFFFYIDCRHLRDFVVCVIYVRCVMDFFLFVTWIYLNTFIYITILVCINTHRSRDNIMGHSSTYLLINYNFDSFHSYLDCHRSALTCSAFYRTVCQHNTCAALIIIRRSTHRWVVYAERSRTGPLTTQPRGVEARSIDPFNFVKMPPL